MPTINEVTTLEVKDEVAVLTLNSPPVNALSANVREGLNNGISDALKDDSVKSIVIICNGRTFIAGADITEFGQAPKGPSLYEVQDMIENSTKPVIAAIHGTALGGGLEVALTCHYRIAVPSAKNSGFYITSKFTFLLLAIKISLIFSAVLTGRVDFSTTILSDLECLAICLAQFSTYVRSAA